MTFWTFQELVMELVHSTTQTVTMANVHVRKIVPMILVEQSVDICHLIPLRWWLLVAPVSYVNMAASKWKSMWCFITGVVMERKNQVILNAFLSSADFFLTSTFLVNSSMMPSEIQTACIQIRSDLLWGLIWVQTVWKGYQQTTLFGKELKNGQNFCSRGHIQAHNVITLGVSK